MGRDPDLGRMRDCISDEHYIPTLLSTLGLENEAACQTWGVVALDWSAGGAHPRTYSADEVTPALFQQARGVPDNLAGRAQRSAAQQFVNCSSIEAEAGDSVTLACMQARLPWVVMLPGVPPLTVRKFPGGTAAAVQRLFSDCSNGMNLLGLHACKGMLREVTK